MASKTVNVSLSEQIVEELDRLAKHQRRTRSSLLRDAIIEYMDKKVRWEDLQADAAERARRLGISTEEDVERLVDEVRESLYGKRQA
jgi:predicted transcriptional regulator